jgi:hypothetical protein
MLSQGAAQSSDGFAQAPGAQGASSDLMFG